MKTNKNGNIGFYMLAYMVAKGNHICLHAEISSEKESHICIIDMDI